MAIENTSHFETPISTDKTPAWNVVVTLRDQGFKDAKRVLRQFGVVTFTSFFNVLIVHVEDLEDFLHDFALEFARKPFLQDSISRLTPVKKSFVFNSKEEFEHKVKSSLDEWLDRLEKKTFYVRMHRRGFKESMSSLQEEQLLDHYILSKLQEKGTSAKITFADPDFIIDVETLNNQAGLSIWSREEIQAYPFLNLD